VQTVALEQSRKSHRLWSFWLPLIILLSIVALTPLIVKVAALVAAIVLMIINRRSRHSPPLYALLLETTGHPQTVLASPDHAELSRLSDIIVDAIENPPASERSLNIRNMILGDQITQTGGRHNIIRTAS
jgi:hypothetical protein